MQDKFNAFKTNNFELIRFISLSPKRVLLFLWRRVAFPAFLRLYLLLLHRRGALTLVFEEVSFQPSGFVDVGCSSELKLCNFIVSFAPVFHCSKRRLLVKEDSVRRWLNLGRFVCEAIALHRVIFLGALSRLELVVSR